MIEISAEAACFLYLLLTFTAVLAIWLFQKKKGRIKDTSSHVLKTYTCEFCTSRFVGESMKPFVRCPECHSLNNNLSSRK